MCVPRHADETRDLDSKQPPCGAGVKMTQQSLSHECTTVSSLLRSLPSTMRRKGVK